MRVFISQQERPSETLFHLVSRTCLTTKSNSACQTSTKAWRQTVFRTTALGLLHYGNFISFPIVDSHLWCGLMVCCAAINHLLKWHPMVMLKKLKAKEVRLAFSPDSCGKWRVLLRCHNVQVFPVYCVQRFHQPLMKRCRLVPSGFIFPHGCLWSLSPMLPSVDRWL